MDTHQTRVIFGALSGLEAIRPLTLDLLESGCSSRRIFYLFNRVEHPGGRGPEVFELCPLGRFRTARLWGVRQKSMPCVPAGAGQRQWTTGIRLLTRLFWTDAPLDWHFCQQCLNADCPLILVQLPLLDSAEPSLARCVLAYATDRLHVLDIQTERGGHPFRLS